MRWFLLAGVWGLYASFGLVATCLAPLVPLVESELSISHAAMGSVMGAWQFVYIAAAIPCGILLDRMWTTLHMTQKRYFALICMFLFGMGILKTWWDPNGGDLVERELDPEQLQPGLDGQPIGGPQYSTLAPVG